jgi:hypothetical protein
MSYSMPYLAFLVVLAVVVGFGSLWWEKRQANRKGGGTP